MIGAIVCGYFSSKYQLKNVLGTVYMLRAIFALSFIFLMPKNIFSVILFAIAIGMTCDATVSPTSEIIRNKFGVRMLGILFGVAYISHQLGSFISSSVAGQIVQLTNSYNLLWTIDILLCVMSGICVYALNKGKDLHKKDNLHYVESAMLKRHLIRLF